MGCQGSLPHFLFRVLTSSDHFLTHVGVPTIRYYDNHTWLHGSEFDGPRSSTAFIFVPFIDPGRDKYGKQPEALRRVLLLSWMAVLALGSYMMDGLEGLSEEAELDRREKICKAVIARFEKDAKILIQTLDRAKTELFREWTTQNAARTAPSPEVRSEISSKNAKVYPSAYFLTVIGKGGGEPPRIWSTAFRCTPRASGVYLAKKITRPAYPHPENEKK